MSLYFCWLSKYNNKYVHYVLVSYPSLKASDESVGFFLSQTLLKSLLQTQKLKLKKIK